MIAVMTDDERDQAIAKLTIFAKRQALQMMKTVDFLEAILQVLQETGVLPSEKFPEALRQARERSREQREALEKDDDEEEDILEALRKYEGPIQ
jgi:hypothetical protein